MINKEKYPLSENNFHKEIYTKRQIIIGHTSRKDMYHFSSWINRLNGKNKKTAAFTIDKDGTIYQHYDPKYYSEFVGNENIDKPSISITLVNEGWLRKDSLNGTYIDWLGHIYRIEGVFTKRWREHSYWIPYTKEQEESLLKLTNKLCKEFNINNDCIGHNVVYNGTDLFDGIVFRSNYSDRFTDISPAFNIKIFNKKEKTNTHE